MSHSFLLASWGSLGNLSPLLTAGRLLRRNGHHVRVIADPQMRQTIEAAGFDFVSWRRAPTGQLADPSDFSDPEDWSRQAIFEPAAAYATDILEEIIRVQTDAVLSLDVIFGAVLGAEAAGIPIAMLSPHASLRPLRNVPPPMSTLPQPRTAEERAEVEAENEHMCALLNSGISILNKARSDLGLAALSDVVEIFDHADRVLLAISQTFDFPTDDLPANTVYVGPLLDVPTGSAPWRAPWTERAVCPRALVSCSTAAQGQTGLVQKVIDALGMMDIEAVVTTGPNLDAADLRAPGNVHVLPSASHDAVMKDVSLVVTHGGHGTVARALVNGLPLLVLPLARDQAGNAARVVAKGAGLMLPPAASEIEIASAVNKLVKNPTFKIASRRTGDCIRADMDASILLDEMEMLAAAGRKGARRAALRA